MKQPREDISGTLRDDNDLISLDERAIAHRDALIALAWHLRNACMVGNPAPIVERMSQRLRNPQPGDLVIETSSAIWGRNADNALKGFGYLIEKRREWWHTDEEWGRIQEEDPYAYGEEDPRPTDEAWYVQYGPQPEDVCRWVNCDFMAIPVDRRMFVQPFGQRGESGAVVITRDDLLGTLADSGFQLRIPASGSDAPKDDQQ